VKAIKAGDTNYNAQTSAEFTITVGPGKTLNINDTAFTDQFKVVVYADKNGTIQEDTWNGVYRNSESKYALIITKDPVGMSQSSATAGINTAQYNAERWFNNSWMGQSCPANVKNAAVGVANVEWNKDTYSKVDLSLEPNVFLLSMKELTSWGSNNWKYTPATGFGGNNHHFWMRGPAIYVAYCYGGSISSTSFTNNHALRPALWVQIAD
jgi:hypothetical protein